jgi:Spy/CpxP family protein refolding chaperone
MIHTMKKTVLAALLAAATLSTASPVFADPPSWAHGGGNHGRDRGWGGAIMIVEVTMRPPHGAERPYVAGQ